MFIGEKCFVIFPQTHVTRVIINDKIISKRQDRKQILIVSYRHKERFAYVYVCNKNIRFFVELLRPLKKFRCIIKYESSKMLLLYLINCEGNVKFTSLNVKLRHCVRRNNCTWMLILMSTYHDQ